MRGSNVHSRNLSMGEYLLARYRRRRPKLPFRARNEREMAVFGGRLVFDLMDRWLEGAS
jgi:hypothetical protein